MNFFSILFFIFIFNFSSCSSIEYCYYSTNLNKTCDGPKSCMAFPDSICLTNGDGSSYIMIINPSNNTITINEWLISDCLGTANSTSNVPIDSCINNSKQEIGYFPFTLSLSNRKIIYFYLFFFFKFFFLISFLTTKIQYFEFAMFL